MNYERWLKLLDIPMQLETERLRLRILEDPDAEESCECTEESREHLAKHLRWAVDKFLTVAGYQSRNPPFRARFWGREDLHYFIFEKSSGRMIGSTGGYLHYAAHPHLGCWLFVI